ncbi:MAG: S8 family serine peptidase, partial [Planctomycetes bacterium]|nr:S8 family serine peptidase [Planctomycetota bacterium]
MIRSLSLLFAAVLVVAGALPCQDVRGMLQLRAATFDPQGGPPAFADGFRDAPDAELGIVQFRSSPQPADRELLAAHGQRVLWYLPQHAYVVRGPAVRRRSLDVEARVRWTGAYRAAFKLAPALRQALLTNRLVTGRYLVVMADPRRDEASLVRRIRRLGGSIWRHAAGNLLLEADLDGAQLRGLLDLDTVLWIQPATPASDDMDNARIQGGANQLEPQGGTGGGFTGKGVRGHVLEGIYPTHPEYAANAWRTAPVSLFSGGTSNHGNSTFGILFASGVDPMARGMLPDGQGLFTDYFWVLGAPPMANGNNSRYGVVRELTDPTLPHRCLFQTASWGYARTLYYDARSAEMDWIIAEFDLPIFQSQSNSGNQMSRPQAWAKNIVSVGAIEHHDTATPVDDTGSLTSTGPATDGRIKPDLCGYWDDTYTTSGATGYTAGFGGTSGATPMIAGHAGLILELFTDGVFGHELPANADWTNRFDRRPHFTTTKALLINTARQYPHAQIGGRYRQGWGFPSVADLWDLRDEMLVLDEADVLQQGAQRTYTVLVKAGTPQLRATMTFADPAGNPAAARHRVNDLDLEVTAPDGTTYHGNVGLVANTASTPGGVANDYDTVENVFVPNPAPGLWTARVTPIR